MKALEILEEISILIRIYGERWCYPTRETILKAIKELEKLEEVKTCDGCNHLETQIKVLQYSCMPEPCRSCKRKALDRYEPKDKQ